MEIVLFYVTFSDRESAESICESLLKEKWIACFNLKEIQSHFEWQGEYHKEGEVLAYLKTTIELQEKVQSKIIERHPYDVPCILSWKVEANAPYGKWVYDVTNQG